MKPIKHKLEQKHIALAGVDNLRVYATLRVVDYLDGCITQQSGTATTLFFSAQIPELIRGAFRDGGAAERDGVPRARLHAAFRHRPEQRVPLHRHLRRAGGRGRAAGRGQAAIVWRGSRARASKAP